MNMFELWIQFDWSFFYNGLIDNDLSEAMMALVGDSYMRHSASMSYTINHNALYEVRVGSKCPGTIAVPHHQQFPYQTD